MDPRRAGGDSSRRHVSVRRHVRDLALGSHRFATSAGLNYSLGEVGSVRFGGRLGGKGVYRSEREGASPSSSATKANSIRSF